MRTLLAVAVLLIGCAAHTLAADTPPPAYASNPAFVKAQAEALATEKQRGQELFVADAWRKANKAAGGQCMSCYLHAIRAAMRVGDNKGALKDASAMEAAAQTPADKSDAEMQQGRVLLHSAGEEKFKPAPLEQAHVALARAYATDPNNTNVMFLDGLALARLNKDADASAAFHVFAVHAKPGSAAALRAEHFAENPQLAREKTAPPVVVTTLSGKQFNLDDMHGRVVLIDFWATWCGPCNQELPHMQKLAARYKDAPFEVISVSWDSDEAKWKDFIRTHEMTWNQYRDKDHTLSTAFGVDSIPHYFTIDSDGVLTAENVGSGSMVDSRLDKLVQRARESQRTHESAAASAPSPTSGGN